MALGADPGQWLLAVPKRGSVEKVQQNAMKQMVMVCG
jgi:hypothetical protein